ncbi:hypothetical protein VTK73DRAFT_2490 [Phialemonium thermophilum]|uniref:Chitin biosynthesis protein CHS5 n=1 Tax=Phialemonium thermophilum TaxID=223376 RepID=A0ABR3Y1B7_9PEZI
MLVSLTVGKVDAGVTVLLTPDKRLIEFPSILLPPNITSGSIVDITVARNTASEAAAEQAFRALQDRIFASFGAATPSKPVLRCRNATQTSVVLEWDPIELATADLLSLALYRNDQKAGAIPRPLATRSTKISGLAVDTEYVFHLVLRTTAGTYASDRVAVRTHKMTDLSGITVTPGIMPAATRERLARAIERIGAKMVDGVRIDTTHFVTTEGRGVQWEKAVEMNIPVVRPEWVDACEKNGRILGVTRFYLDALRPGPPGDDGAAQQQQQQQPAQPAPQATSEKDLPSAPAEGAANGDETGDKEGVAESPASAAVASQPEQKEVAKEVDRSSDESEESESDQRGEQEEKARSGAQDEQKVRADERESQKLAVRPGPAATQPSADEEGDDSAEDDEQDSGKGDKSPGDASSFQEVKL